MMTAYIYWDELSQYTSIPSERCERMFDGRYDQHSLLLLSNRHEI